MFRFSLLLIVAFTVSGCASSGRVGNLPDVAPGEASSELGLIRVSSPVGLANSYYVSLDGKDVFSLRSGQHTQFPITAGQHYISVKCFGGWSPTWKEDSTSFVARANEPSYFKISPDLRCAQIVQIPVAEAVELKARTKLISPSKESNKS